MKRREFVRATCAAGLLVAGARAGACALALDDGSAELVVPVRRLPLLFGIGAAGAAAVRDLVDARPECLGVDLHAMWAPLPHGLPGDVLAWCEDSHPFSAANASTVWVVVSLAGSAADLLPALAAAWRARGVPVRLLAIYPDDDQPVDVWDLAVARAAQALAAGVAPGAGARRVTEEAILRVIGVRARVA